MNDNLHKVLIQGTRSTPTEVTIAFLDVSPPSGTPLGTLLLIHGFPETSYQFRHVIPRFVESGYRVIAPDYRGAGHSSKPREGFDKVTLAQDLHTLLTEHLKIKEKVHIVGHDIGGMVAHSFATRFESHTKSLMWGECPLPGTSVYDKFLLNPGMWHFHFHWQADLPETLTQGREAVYLKHFYDRLTQNPHAISKDDVEYYAYVYAQPGGMRCGFDLYRSFHQDVDENKAWLKEHGKSKVPVSTLSGDGSFSSQIAGEQANEMYENVETAIIPNCGHWCAEEKPEIFAEKVLAFVRKHN